MSPQEWHHTFPYPSHTHAHTQGCNHRRFYFHTEGDYCSMESWAQPLATNNILILSSTADWPHINTMHDSYAYGLIVCALATEF